MIMLCVVLKTGAHRMSKTEKQPDRRNSKIIKTSRPKGSRCDQEWNGGLTVLVCGASVCFDMTMVVVFKSTRAGPGDFGVMLETSISAARTASNTYK